MVLALTADEIQDPQKLARSTSHFLEMNKAPLSASKLAQRPMQ